MMTPRLFLLFLFLLASLHAEDPGATGGKNLAYYGIFDIDRKPELICSHAGAGLPDIRFVPGPKLTGSASMALDIDLPDRAASGRFLFPIPHVRFQEISFWLQTGQLGEARFEISPQLLVDNLQALQFGDDLMIYHFRPVLIAGGNGWQQVRLRIPEDVINYNKEAKPAVDGNKPTVPWSERGFLMFEFGIKIATESKPAAWKGSLFLDRLEFLHPNP